MLIKCPECGNEVSDKADVCTHCGYPLEQKDVFLDVKREDCSSGKAARVINILLGLFGILLLSGVLRSSGGIEGNRIPTIIAWSIIMGSIFGVLAIKKQNKIFTVIFGVMYILAMLVSLNAIKTASIYLIVEFFIGLNIFCTIKYLEEIKCK